MLEGYLGSDPALQAALAKADRAVEHFETLKTRLGELLDRKPYRVPVEFEPETGWHVAYMRVLEEPPLGLAVIVGEIAYQQLSALNLIAWELAIRHCGRETAECNARLIQFPIATCEEDFRSSRVLRFVSEHTATVFEELQPYRGFHGKKGPREHPLPLTKEIADADKHRELAGVFARVNFEGIPLAWDTSLASDPVFESLIPPDGQLKHRTQIARLRFNTGKPETEVRVDGLPAVDVLFSTRSWTLTLAEIEGTILAMPSMLRDLDVALATAKAFPS